MPEHVWDAELTRTSKPRESNSELSLTLKLSNDRGQGRGPAATEISIVN